MVRVISQNTFNEAVKENIEEFSMTPEEAVVDATKQFEAQGIDLSNIIKDLAITNKNEANLVTDSLKKIENIVQQKSDNKLELIESLNILKTECDKDIPYKIMAAKNGAYDTLLNTVVAYDSDKDIIKKCLLSMISLMTGQPDLLTASGIDLMIKYFKDSKDVDIQLLVLKWIKECCIKHENNRQHIFEADVLDYLKPILSHGPVTLLKDVCAVLRALVLDDDVRVEFGKAHEHARIIASDTLNTITTLLTSKDVEQLVKIFYQFLVRVILIGESLSDQSGVCVSSIFKNFGTEISDPAEHKDDESLINDLLLTLSTLIVRNEFCQKVEDAGGLDFILEALKDYNSNEKINRQAFKLLKVLAGNDQCKINVIQKGGAEIIAHAMNTHKKSAKTVVIALNCIAALTLRSPENSKVAFEAGIPEIIVEFMKLHSTNMNVQKSASWAIRNMVSRSRYQNDKFLSLGVEEILQEDLKKFKECQYDIKAALRDLDCKVNFKEEWTGKGGKLTTQADAE